MNKGSLCSEQVVIYVYNLHNSKIYTCTISSNHRLTQKFVNKLSHGYHVMLKWPAVWIIPSVAASLLIRGWEGSIIMSLEKRRKGECYLSLESDAIYSLWLQLYTHHEWINASM